MSRNNESGEQTNGKRKPLADSFGRAHNYLRISVTERCNLRCLYCMPAEGIKLKPRDEILRFEEILRLVRLFASMGVDKIRLTGGEPLVRRNLEQLIGDIHEIPGIRAIAMTTNAVGLEGRILALRDAGLTHLNISLDTLRPERFKQITLRDEFDSVMSGIDAALDAGFNPLKLNMVVMGGVNEDEILDFAALAKDRPINVRYIEYMPFEGNQWRRQEMVPYGEMKRAISQRYPLKPLDGGGDHSRVAKDFQPEGFAGQISFITSMTEDFCSTCSRLRLTADGRLKTCLFYPPEASLRDAMRGGAGDDRLVQLIRDTLNKKKSGHAPLDDLADMPNESMTLIGG